jgi:hypothetical protein
MPSRLFGSMNAGRRNRSQGDLRTTTAERLEAIVEAAERAAEKVIDDAEAQAREYLAQARAEAERMSSAQASELSILVDSLLRQAKALREEAERLQAALEGAQERIAPQRRRRQADEEELPPQAEVLTLRTPQSEPEPSFHDEGGSLASGARLLATQMAVSGSSREEIEERLRSGFDIEDTRGILDAILGPED